MTKAETLSGPGLDSPIGSALPLLSGDEEVSRQRHRDRQIAAHLTGLIQGGDPHHVAVSREPHAGAGTQPKLVKGRQQFRVGLNRRCVRW